MCWRAISSATARHRRGARRLCRRAAAAHGPHHAAVAPAIRQQSQGAAAAVPRPHLDFHLRRDQGAGDRGRPDWRWRRSGRRYYRSTIQGRPTWQRSRTSTITAGKTSFRRPTSKLYSGWRRETFVGPRPALLAIDLYDLVYRGGPRPPIEINDTLPEHLRNLRASGDRADQAAVRRRAAAPASRSSSARRRRGPTTGRPARSRPRARGRRRRPTASRSIKSFRSSRRTS